MPFNSQEFKEFAASYEFELITSSPGYPQSNGKVENAVKTAKNIMMKSKKAGTDVYLSLLEWRNTPTEGMSSSPAQRMFGRRTRTLLPTTSHLLKPKVQENVKEKLIKQNSKQAKYYDRNAKELPPLQTGDIVRVSPKFGDRERKWFKARVEDQVDIRSYEVRAEDGKVYRRNRRHLRQSQEPFGQPSKPSSIIPCQVTQPRITESVRPEAMECPVQHNEDDQHKPGQLTTVLETQKSNNHSLSTPVKPAPVVTRSGRSSRPPKYLQD